MAALWTVEDNAMLGRVLPTLVMTVGSYLAGRIFANLADKAVDAMAEKKAQKKSAPKDLGALDYDPETDSYRPKS